MKVYLLGVRPYFIGDKELRVVTRRYGEGSDKDPGHWRRTILTTAFFVNSSSKTEFRIRQLAEQFIETTRQTIAKPYETVLVRFVACRLPLPSTVEAPIQSVKPTTDRFQSSIQGYTYKEVMTTLSTYFIKKLLAVRQLVSVDNSLRVVA